MGVRRASFAGMVLSVAASAAVADPVVTGCFGDSALGEGVVIPTGESAVFDVNGDGEPDISFYVVSNQEWYVRLLDPRYPSMGYAAVIDEGSFSAIAMRFDEGDPIALGEGGFWTFSARAATFLNDPTPGYIGFNFRIGSGSHLGWAEITVEARERVIVHRYGYETEAQALIAAGEGTVPGDFNRDGSVDTLDVLAFLNAWSASDPRADCDESGTVNTQDVTCFLNRWVSGGC